MEPKNRTTEVLKAIDKTGFPLELRISELLREREYHVANSLYFVDQDENKGREVDLRALKNVKLPGGTLFVRHCLVVQCKRSQKWPWVVFTSPRSGYDRGYKKLDVRGIAQGSPWLEQTIQDVFDKNHPLYTSPRLGRAFTELFRKTDETKDADENIFGALVTAVKATVAVRNAAFAARYNSIVFYYPVVVFEGDLWESYLERQNLRAEKTERVTVSLFYESPKYPSEGMLVPIVTPQELPKFLTELETVLIALGAHFEKHLGWFDRESEPGRSLTAADPGP
jgi:hypothetical protein